MTAGTLTVNGSTAAASTVNVGTAGTPSGAGTINGTRHAADRERDHQFWDGRSYRGNLGRHGGQLEWRGNSDWLGDFPAAETFNIGSGANLTASSGVNVTGGTISAADTTSTLTGSLNYTSSSDSTFQGVIAGASTVTINSAGATLTLSGANTYSGATNVTAGTLTVNGSTAAASTVNVGTAGNAGRHGNDQRQCHAGGERSHLFWDGRQHRGDPGRDRRQLEMMWEQ